MIELIRNRLADFIHERDIKIVRLSKETGISRNTITNTASNSSDMLHMNTIDKLCSYLDITPCEFFDYIPFEFEYELTTDNEIDMEWNSNLAVNEKMFRLDHDILIDITNDKIKSKYDGYVRLESSNIVDMSVFEENTLIFKIELNQKDEQELNNIFQNIPKAFIKLINKKLTNDIRTFLLSNFDKSDKPGDTFEYNNYDFIKNTNIAISNEFLKFY